MLAETRVTPHGLRQSRLDGSPRGAQCTGMYFFHRTRNTSKYPVKVLTGLHSSVYYAVRCIIRYNMFLVFLRVLLKKKGAFPMFHFLEIAVLPKRCNIFFILSCSNFFFPSSPPPRSPTIFLSPFIPAHFHEIGRGS